MNGDHVNDSFGFGANSPINGLLCEAAGYGFRSDAHTDLVIRCSANPHSDYYCHKFIVLRQVPYLENNYRMYHDYQIGCDIITIDDLGYDYAFMEPMLQFIYTGNYHSYDGNVAALSAEHLHAKVYMLASSFKFQELMELSKAKFSVCLENTLPVDDILDEPSGLIELVYETSTGRDRGLRDVMLAFCVRHAQELMSNVGFYYNSFPEDFWREFVCHFAGCPKLPENPFV